MVGAKFLKAEVAIIAGVRRDVSTAWKELEKFDPLKGLPICLCMFPIM